MDAAMLTMIAALLVAVLASARDQRRDSVKTGERLSELNTTCQLLAVSHEQLLSDFAEHKRATDKNHTELTDSLGDARERLARIEGYLRIDLPPPAESEAGQ